MGNYLCGWFCKYSPHWTRLVFFRIVLLTAPNPALNNTPSIRRSETFMMAASSGVSMGSMITNSILMQKEPMRESRSLTLRTRSRGPGLACPAGNTKISKA